MNNGQFLYFYDSEWVNRPYYSKEKGKNIQQHLLYSIGLTKYDTIAKEIVDTLYTVIKPNIELKDSLFKFTHGNKEEVSQGEDFEVAYKKVIDFLEGNVCYSWGGEDLRVLRFNIEYYESNLSEIGIENVQKRIAHKISPMISGKSFGLKKFKKICNYDEPVQHNALNDAIDLTLCVKTILNQEPLNQEVLDKYIAPMKDILKDPTKKVPQDIPCILIDDSYYKKVLVEIKNPNKSAIKKIKSLIAKSVFLDEKESFKTVEDETYFLNGEIIETNKDLVFTIVYDVWGKDVTIYCKGKYINKEWKSFDTDIMRKKMRKMILTCSSEPMIMTLQGEKVED